MACDPNHPSFAPQKPHKPTFDSGSRQDQDPHQTQTLPLIPVCWRNNRSCTPRRCLCQLEQNIPYKNVSHLNKKSTVTNISHGTTLTNTPSYTVHIEQILNEQLMFDPQTVHLIDTTFSRRYSNHCTLHLRYVTHDPPATPKTLPNPKSRVTPPATSKTLPKPLIDTHSTNYRRGRPHV